MYQCPNCGSGLKYDIEQGKLVCNHCQSYFNPYEIEKESDGYEDEYFEATHFVCPQCGGEILSTDNAAAGFCSYCGASTVLTSRISKELKPNRIIPFKITKDQCHTIFKKRIKKARFAPKAFKDADSIQGFRGIYMPYWLYKTKHSDKVNLKGEKEYRKGDYKYTDHFDVSASVEAEYNGFYYDASSTFYDDISESLNPFDFNDSMEFTPSFYSGFYADIPDVPSEVHEYSAIDESVKASFSSLRAVPELKDISFGSVIGDSNSEFGKQLNTQCDKPQGVMLPVWFMSYRAGDRVAYATINGQNGKIVTDIPVDKKKYIAGSCILALPVFLLLNFLFTFIPSNTLLITSILAAITSILLCNEMTSIYKRENNIGDKGIIWKNINKTNSGLHGETETTGNKKSRIAEVITKIALPLIILAIFINILFVMSKPKAAFSIICTIVSVICICVSKAMNKGLNIKGKHVYFAPVITTILAAIILFIQPVSDIYYYLGSLIQIFSVISVFMAIIGNYNILCMRYLPQFDKKGGDDNA